MKRLCRICEDELYVSAFEPIDSRMYLLLHGNSALIVDPCVDEEALLKMQTESVDNVTVLLTHEHYDHISGVNWLKKNFKCQVIAQEACARNMGKPNKNFSAMFEALFINDEEKLEIIRNLKIKPYECTADITFLENYRFEWQGHCVEIFSAPGHSQGSAVIVLDGSNLFTGDSLLPGTPVITKLPGGSRKDYEQLTEPLLERLCAGKRIFPGHGEWFYG